MNRTDRAEYIKRYNRLLDEYGYDIKALGWGGDKERQLLRFRTAMELSFFTHKPVKSVLDIGCGFGDMGIFIKCNFPEVEYAGIDINPELIDKGLKMFPDLDLRVCDILETDNINKADLVCESGIFNYKLENENQINYIESMACRLYSLCNVGVSMDFMSTYVDYKHDNAFHMPEETIMNISKKLSKRIVLRNDYLDYEYCVYILKDFNTE